MARQEVIDVSCGENFASAVTKNGDLFTWGSGEYGQLGHNNTADLIIPKKIGEFDHNIVQVSCGEAFTA